MLTVKNIDVYYGKVQALHGVSIEVQSNEIISIIGSNGAGKSTLMRTIMGLNKPKVGQITFLGEAINKLKTDAIVKREIVYVPEGRQIFPELTVTENLEMGAYSKRYHAKELHEKIAEMFTMFPRLKERHKQMGGSLSGGEQQMLAIARGLMVNPKLIMFDEPSLGLAPVIVDEMFEIILNINKNKHIPIILVEQNAYMALKISYRGYVLENGFIKYQGKSEDLANSPEIKRAYLGG
jgi:branched-chain amino acid transport system ATP-binding protein